MKAEKKARHVKIICAEGVDDPALRELIKADGSKDTLGHYGSLIQKRITNAFKIAMEVHLNRLNGAILGLKQETLATFI